MPATETHGSLRGFPMTKCISFFNPKINKSRNFSIIIPKIANVFKKRKRALLLARRLPKQGVEYI
jgi:hypothetical protein